MPDSSPNLFQKPTLTRLAPIERGRIVGGCETYIYLDERGQEYVGKSRLTNHPYLAANELVCARLLARLGIPCPRTTLGTFADASVLLSQRVRSRGDVELYLDRIREDRSILEAWEMVLHIACFDRWVINPDRHLDNVLLVRSGADQLRLYAIDHDRALFGVSPDEDRLTTNHHRTCSDPVLNHRRYFELIAAVGARYADFRSSIALIRSLTDDVIQAAIEEVVALHEVLSRRDAQVLDRILRARRDDIERCMLESVEEGGLAEYLQP